MLRIFGNANLDDTIDELDIEYVQGIIDGANDVTDLADANYDGKIDSQDVERINEIIAGDENELAVADSTSRNVTINMPVKTLIPLEFYEPETHVTQVVKILEAEDMVVGVSSGINASYFPGLADKPAVGTAAATPDYEAIISLSPDIVITLNGLATVTDLEQNFKPTDIPVLGFAFGAGDMLQSDIKTLGFILNRNEEADEYLQWRNGYEQTIADYVASLDEEDKPRIFIEWGGVIHSPSEITTPSKGSPGDFVCNFAGGRNIVADLSVFTNSVPKVDSEWILEENPDVILVYLYPSEGSNSGWNSEDEAAEILKSIVEERPGWSSLDAVKNNRMHILSTEIAWGADGIVGTACIAKWFHPEIDLDPDQIYREFLEQFMGLQYPEGVAIGYPLN